MTKNHTATSHHEVTLAHAAAAAVPALQAIEDGLPLSDAMTADERAHLRHVADMNPPEVVARLITLATRHDGSIAGIPFDPTAAQASVDDAKGARSLVVVGRTFVRRLEDEALRREAAVSEQATAVLLALRGLVRTPQGKAVGQEFAEIMQEKRSARRARRTSAPKPPSTPPTPSTPEAPAPKGNAPTETGT